jgi:hypothetical protein
VISGSISISSGSGSSSSSSSSISSSVVVVVIVVLVAIITIIDDVLQLLWLNECALRTLPFVLICAVETPLLNSLRINNT